MKSAIVTMEVKGGHCEENFAYMVEQIKRAKQEHADLILFPQNCIGGAYGGEHFKDADFCRYLDHFNDLIIQMSEDIAIVWGNIKYRGGKLFNCAFFAYQKETCMCVKPSFDNAFVSDDAFSSLDIHRTISFQGCEMALNFTHRPQPVDWNIHIDARPFDIHENLHLQGNVIYVNAVGMQNEGKAVVMMEGGSAVCKEGEYLWQMPYGEAGYVLVDLDQLTPQQPQKRELLTMLTQAVRGFDAQILGGKQPWIVGLSGGLDSSVSAALLTHALGKQRLIGYGMSSAHNSEQTKSNARQLAEALGIEYREGSIMPLVQATDDVLHEYGYQDAEGLAAENIQARLRGHLLSTFASLYGGVVVNNGNKVENALGYCTLYGDAIGAVGPLGDLTKVQLFELALQLNEQFNQTVIPLNLLPRIDHGNICFEVAPSAELRSNQLDPMKWFYHDYLVDHIGRDMTMKQFLQAYLDGTVWKEEIGAIMRFYHLDDPALFIEDISWFINTANRNVFKHTQVPVILTVSQNGYALRKEIQGFPTKEAYQELLDAIQCMKK